jgi:speckle-type POZ protein
MHCKIVTWINRKTTTGEFSRELPVVLPNNDELINDLSGLFGNEKHSDVLFDIRGQQFKAHKNILSARSSVFSEMFQHEGLEASHQVNIQDIDPEVFLEVLRFIYTGHVPSTKMDALGLGLLAAGEKYLLKNLKDACEKHLVNSLSTENCVEFLLAAKSHSAAYLKKNALDFLRRFPHEVQATDAWKKAEQAHIFLRNIHAIDMGLLHRHGGATPPACKKRK